MKGKGDEMEADEKLLCKRQIFIGMLLIVGLIISTVGCGTSYLRTYQSALQGPDGPKYRMVEWKIEHNLFNTKYQQADREDPEDEWSG